MNRLKIIKIKTLHQVYSSMCLRKISFTLHCLTLSVDDVINSKICHRINIIEIFSFLELCKTVFFFFGITFLNERNVSLQLKRFHVDHEAFSTINFQRKITCSSLSNQILDQYRLDFSKSVCSVFCLC